MEHIALYLGNLFIKLLNVIGAGAFTETIEWIGVKETGYVLLFVIVALIALVVWTKRKGRR
jgi:L-cystine uptake protein TcyP (sodium:dicarboxylate symporter family)